MTFGIRFFATIRGDEPVQDYLVSIPEKERAGVVALIEHLGEMGKLEHPHGKRFTGLKGLYELRYKRHRIFYFYHGRQIILLHAFKKQSQTTPQREIEVAVQRMNKF